jgi:hypothetical protein
MIGSLFLMLSLARSLAADPRDAYWSTDRSEQEQRRLALVRAEQGPAGERHGRIHLELAELDAAACADKFSWADHWAGTYAGMWNGVYLEIAIAPEAGATLARGGQHMQYCSGHMGGIPFLADHGELADACETGVSVNWVIPPEIHGLEDFCRLVFVEINGKRGIIPESGMLHTVNALNAGQRFIYWLPQAELRTRASPSFDPRAMYAEVRSIVLPEPWKSRLLGRRVEFTAKGVARGVRIDSWDESEHLFRVDLEGGTDRGAFVGMTIPFQGKTVSGTLEITHVDTTTCSGVLKIGTPAGRAATPPSIGDTLALPGLARDK